uniref:Uncharacterized protein n=1 Tax=Arundo donax TaxID=35708 RepID=A0A0A9ENZ9_ARUDO
MHEVQEASKDVEEIKRAEIHMKLKIANLADLSIGLTSIEIFPSPPRAP